MPLKKMWLKRLVLRGDIAKAVQPWRHLRKPCRRKEQQEGVKPALKPLQ
jgi:hypothetical protein